MSKLGGKIAGLRKVLVVVYAMALVQWQALAGKPDAIAIGGIVTLAGLLVTSNVLAGKTAPAPPAGGTP